MGEHAVLHGYPCLVAAIDKQIHVTLTSREDNEMHIDSDLGRYSTVIARECNDHDNPAYHFRFVLGTFNHFKKQLPSGCTLKIRSEFSSAVGLGSSAAVIVATVTAIQQWLGASTQLNAVFEHSLKILHAVQGRGSGADIAASTYGGVLKYDIHKGITASLKLRSDFSTVPITLVYCGYKTPTTEVIEKVEAQRQQAPKRFETLFEQIGKQVEIATHALENNDISLFAKALQRNQALMAELGVCDKTLQTIIDKLEQDHGILAAKISGSGLGDCVLGLGQLKNSIDWSKVHPRAELLSADFFQRL